MRERTADEVVEAMKTGKFEDGTLLNKEEAEPLGIKGGIVPSASAPVPPPVAAKLAVARSKKPMTLSTPAPAPTVVTPVVQAVKEESIAEESITEDTAPSGTAKKQDGNYVSPRVVKYILNYLRTVASQHARSVDIGQAAMHDAAAVNKPLPEGTVCPTPRCTAWAGIPCQRMEKAGLLASELVDNPSSKGRAKFIHYRITAAGLAWLEDATKEKGK
jgi:hypothetical protein